MPTAISAEHIAAETERVGGDLDQFDVARVIASTTWSCATVGPRDVHLKILAASGEHNVDHAALADTINIDRVPRRQDLPGQLGGGPR